VHKASKPLPPPEDLLLDYAERLTHHRAGRRAVTIALSKLAPPVRQDDHWRLVENLIQPLILRHGGEVFRLTSGDIAVVFTSLDRQMADRLHHKLRYLFRDDPLIEAEERGGDKTGFARGFDIHHEYDAFLAHARQVKTGRAALPPAAAPAMAGDVAVLTADDLHASLPRDRIREGDPASAPLVTWFKTAATGAASLHRLAARLPAVRIPANTPPSIAFEYLAPHIDGIKALALPGADFERNAEFSQAALGLATRRLLLDLPTFFKSEQPLAIPLTLDDLLSVEFLSFHRAWALGRWVPLTVCIAPGDAGADRDRLRYARDMVRGLGHRIALGPLPVDIYQQRAATSPARLNADVLIFAFDPRLAGADAAPEIAALRAWLGEGGVHDVMLTAAETREAIRFGQSLGATLFLGRQASALVGRG